MAEEIVDAEAYLSPWYSRVFEYLKNRNKIGPAKIELPDCDFFIVGAGRTIRVLRKNSRINTTSLAEQLNSSNNNCRCSFRQSLNLTNKDRFTATEINRIKTNLNENIDDSVIITDQPKFENNDVSMIKRNSNDLANKNKIIKDLEKYIDVLLEEVLNDTVKFMNDADTTLKRSRTILKSSNDEICKINESIDSTKSSLDISFAFPADDLQVEEEKLGDEKKPEEEEKSYVNKAFDGTTSDPDCLNFDLSKPINNHQVNIDCVDSGINSVETVELQLETELTLEQSLMRIIDATFGHEPSSNWNDLVVDDSICNKENKDELINDSIKQQKNNLNDNKIIEHDLNEIISSNNTNDSLDLILNDTNIDVNKFKNSRLKLNDDSKISTTNKNDLHKKANPVVVLCEKFTSAWTGCSGGSGDSKTTDKSIKTKIKNEPLEMRDYRAGWKGFESPPPKIERPLNDSIVYNKNIKPTIVFIHGFGSSADVFELQIEYFTQLGYCCIAPDMLGHGMSSSPNKSHEYHFDKLLNDLELVLQHYAISHGKKCILIAHNYGCSFATAIACKYENFIHQLVLISGGGPTILTPPSKEGPGHCCMRATLSPLLMCGLRRDILYSPRGRQHPYCGNETQDQWPSHMPFILDGMNWPDGDYVYHRRISTPTLLIYGLRDNMVSLVQECQMERTMMKAFLEVLPNAGHMPMTECPEMCNHMINCFIDLWNKNKK